MPLTTSVQDASTQTDMALDAIAGLRKVVDCQANLIQDLQQKVGNLTVKITPPPFSELTFTTDEYVKSYTGRKTNDSG